MKLFVLLSSEMDVDVIVQMYHGKKEEVFRRISDKVIYLLLFLLLDLNMVFKLSWIIFNLNITFFCFCYLNLKLDSCTISASHGSFINTSAESVY